jgi:hypothetical protein
MKFLFKNLLFITATLLLSGSVTYADTLPLSYSGRITDSTGKPFSGKVDLEIDFFSKASKGSSLIDAKVFSGVKLINGTFQIDIELSAAESATLFGNGNKTVYIQVTDLTRDTKLPRQKFNAVPYALKVPVDGSTVYFNNDGNLTVDSSAFTSGQETITDSTDLTTNSVTAKSIITTEQDALKINPYGASGGETGEIQLIDLGGTNYMALKAPDTVTASKVLTLPDGVGAPGEVLSTDGTTGTLSWVTAVAGGNMNTATFDSTPTNGIVDNSQDSALLQGNNTAYHLNTDNHTTGSTNSVFLLADKTKLDAIGATADVTDATTVAAAGAVMDTDFGTNGLMNRTGSGAYSVVVADSANTNSAIVQRDGSGDFSANVINATTVNANVTGALIGNASTATSATNVTGTVAIANGGTGATTNTAARTNLGLGGSAILNVGTAASTVAAGDDSRFTDARAPTTHASNHQNGGGDEIATATPANNAIPKTSGANTLAIGWIPQGSIDHDGLTNYDANDHIDHTGVSLTTAAESGLTGGGDISSTRTLSVDITGTTAEATNDDADTILIHDNTAGALKKMTRANFLSGVTATPAGADTQIQFNDGGSATGADADFVWDNTKKNLGIGTTTPDSSLAIVKSSTSSIADAVEGINSDVTLDPASPMVIGDSIYANQFQNSLPASVNDANFSTTTVYANSVHKGASLYKMEGIKNQVRQEGNGTITTGTGVSNTYSIIPDAGNTATTTQALASSNTVNIQGAGTSLATTATGVKGVVDVYGGDGISATAGTTYGGYFVSGARTSGTITDSYGIYADVENTGTTTTGYGVYIGDVNATTEYGLYAVGADDINYLAGNLGIGSSSPAAKLDVNGTVQFKVGTPVAGQVLTATDANGLATWQAVSAASGNDFTSTSSAAATVALTVKGAGSQTANLLEVQNSGSTVLTVIDEDGYIGIGTSDPSKALTIVGTSNTSSISLQTNGAVNTGIDFADGTVAEWAINRIDSTNALEITESGVAARMTFEPGGFVGIGIADPTALLHTKTATGSNYLKVEAGTGNSEAGITLTPSGTWGSTVEYGYTGGSASNTLNFFNRTTAQTEMMIDGNGNVGINNIVPSDTLDVGGTVGIHNTSASGLNIYTHSDTAGQAPVLSLSRSRNIQTVPTVVSSGDTLGTVEASGYSGAAYVVGPVITMATTETWNGTSSGSKINFSTVDNGTTTRDERMVIDHNGNVGIGSISPGAPLDVAGDSILNNVRIGVTLTTWGQFIHEDLANNGTSFALAQSPAGGTILNAATGQTFDIRRAGSTSSLKIDSSGNVSIGTITPNQLLTLEGTMSLKEQAAANADTAAYGQVWVKDTVPNELWYTDDAGTDVQLGAGGGSGDIVNTGQTGIVEIGTNDANTLTFETNNTDRMTILSTGEVGIGTTSPAKLLHIRGSLATAVIDSTSGDGGLTFAESGTDKWQINYEDSSERLNFYEFGVGERMTILPTSGNVGIGTSAPNQKLSVEGTMSLKEQASANADAADYGQVWVKNSVPNELWYTDDAGTDVQLGAGGASVGGDPTQLQFNDGGAFNGSANLAWDNAKSILKVAGPGSGNMFIGDGAGNAWVSGADNNTFGGYHAGNINASGDANTFFGKEAGRANVGGHNNVFTGAFSGYNNTTGGDANVFTGAYAGNANVTGKYNTFTGHNAGRNSLGDNNVFSGYEAGLANTTGAQNTYIGKDAGKTSTNNLTNATAIGYNTQVTASNSLILGNGANIGIGTTAPNAALEVTGQIVTTLPTPLAPAGTTETIDFDNGNVQVLDLDLATGTVVVTLSNPVAGGSYAIKIIQGITPRTITWPAAVKWPGGTAMTLSTGDNEIDLLTLIYDGTNYLAVGGNDFK